MVKLVRYALPATILVVGVVLLAAGGGGATSAFGIVLVGIAGLVALASLFARLSIASERDREREETARRTFTRTGRWTSGGTR
jgi:hypothetical protein